jgi:hypothetical protein
LNLPVQPTPHEKLLIRTQRELISEEEEEKIFFRKKKHARFFCEKISQIKFLKKEGEN